MFSRSQRNRPIICAVVGILAIGCLPLCRAQDSDQSNSAENTQSPDQEQMESDNLPPSGAQTLSVGTPESTTNILNASVRGLQIYEAIKRSDPGYTNEGDTYAFAGLTLDRLWKRNALLLDYDAGAIYYNEQILRNIQILNVLQRVAFGRWTLTAQDYVTYSPEPLFGLPGLSLDKQSPPNSNLLPDESILTNRQSRVTNTSLGQVEYALSHRSSITATGSYSFQKYIDAGLLANDHTIGMASYAYALSPNDAVSLTYMYTQFHSNLFGRSRARAQGPSIGYSRRFGPRFAFQASGGPLFEKTPFGSHTIARGDAVLQYALRRTQFQAGVSRGMVSGGGLFLSSNTTVAEFGMRRSLSRSWNVLLHAGYANHSTFGLNRTINSGFAAAEVHRTFARHGGMFLAYYFQRQVTSEVCQQNVCAGDLWRHGVGFGLEWQFPLAKFH